MFTLGSWLEANKIFFEIASTIVFGVASILIAMASYRVYKQQLLTARLQFKPYFSVQRRHVLDDDPGHVKQIEFLVFNYGAPAYNIRVEHNSLLLLFWYPQSKAAQSTPSFRREVVIPMNNYLSVRHSTGMPEGLIMTISGENNRQKYMALKRNLSAAVGIDIFFSPRTIITVTYENRLGERATEHFLEESKVDKEELECHFSVLKNTVPFFIDSKDAVQILKDKIKNT